MYQWCNGNEMLTRQTSRGSNNGDEESLELAFQNQRSPKVGTEFHLGTFKFTALRFEVLLNSAVL